MKFLDLFAGIGGFRLGMESAGHECIGFCEIDKYARASYKDRSKKSMKLQSVAKVSENFDLNVKDDEADAILIGSYFVNHGHEFGDLESHRIS